MEKATLWHIHLATKVLVGQRDATRSTSVTMIETSSKTSGDDATFVSGRRTSTLSISGIGSTQKEATLAGYWELEAAMKAGVPVTITETEYTDKTSATPVVGAETVTYSALVSKLDASYPDNAEVTFSADFQITGEVTRTTNAGA